MISAFLVSQFLQLYLKKRLCKLYQKSHSDTLVLDEPKLFKLEYVSVETSLKRLVKQSWQLESGPLYLYSSNSYLMAKTKLKMKTF